MTQKTPTGPRNKIQSLIKKRMAETPKTEIAARFVVFDIVIARINQKEDEFASLFGAKLALKGGYTLIKRLKNIARTTKDLDFVVCLNDKIDGLVEEQMAKDMISLITGTKSFLDGCDIKMTAVRQYASSPLNGCWNIALDVSCEGKRVGTSEITIDLLFGDFLDDTAHYLEMADDLKNAYIIPKNSTTRVISIAQQIGEKLHALAKKYDDGSENPRTKDLFDIPLFIKSGNVDIIEVAKITNKIFLYRKPVSGYDMPDELPPFPKEWNFYYDKFAKEARTELTFKSAEAMVRSLYLEIVSILQDEKGK